jgi:hypothetical protein
MFFFFFIATKTHVTCSRTKKKKIFAISNEKVAFSVDGLASMLKKAINYMTKVRNRLSAPIVLVDNQQQYQNPDLLRRNCLSLHCK